MGIHVHDRTQYLLSLVPQTLPHALVFAGPKGVGKREAAQAWLAKRGIAATGQRFITPNEKDTITVEAIRELYKSTRTKSDQPTVFIVDEADKMSEGGQNAFLKLLEEPNNSVHFILLANNLDALLTTIRSRTQIIEFLPLSEEAIKDLLNKHTIDEVKKQQILFLADGRAGLAKKLAEDEDFFNSYKELMDDAKILFGSNTFERLKLINKLGNDRNKAIAVIEAAISIALRMLERSALDNDFDRHTKVASLLETTLERLVQNGNCKIQLTYLALNL